MSHMRQSSLFSFLTPTSSVDNSESRHLFVDLFCGIGGASQGAFDAGYAVVLAVDSCAAHLAVHKANHTRCRHMCLSLPPVQPLPLPAAGAKWHLHGSPPCQAVSQANRGLACTQESRLQGIEMVLWYLQFAIASSATSWSMEQVPDVAVLVILKKLKRSFPKRCDFAVFRFEKLGLPQKRRRVIAGSPDVVARLRRVAPWRTPVSRIIEKPRGTHIRNRMCNIKTAYTPSGERYLVKATKYSLATPVSGPSHTILAKASMRWASPSTDLPLLPFTARESAAVQTFPSTYRLHHRKCYALQGVGNALPPLVATQLLCDSVRHSKLLDGVALTAGAAEEGSGSPAHGVRDAPALQLRA